MQTTHCLWMENSSLRERFFCNNHWILKKGMLCLLFEVVNCVINLYIEIDKINQWIRIKTELCSLTNKNINYASWLITEALLYVWFWVMLKSSCDLCNWPLCIVLYSSFLVIIWNSFCGVDVGVPYTGFSATSYSRSLLCLPLNLCAWIHWCVMIQTYYKVLWWFLLITVFFPSKCLCL